MRFKNPQAALIALSKSNFRKRFNLEKKELFYIKEKGWPLIKKHIQKLAITRISPAKVKNDGKQTPMKGHPVFIAQHATATCCRNCIQKWHHIQKGKPLSKKEIRYVIQIIEAWLKKEYEKNAGNIGPIRQQKLFDI